VTNPKSTARHRVGTIVPGKQYPGVRGKVVDWAEHTFEEGGLLFIRVRFTDKTELCWTVNTGIVIEEADLSDWKTGHLKLFVEGESNWEGQ
jgi:hypothetical protein